MQGHPQAAEGPPPRRLFVYNGGFLTQGRVRRILELAGYDIRLGAPGPEDLVGVWGKSPTSPRGEAVARHRAAPVLRVEDAFLRSVLPGRAGSPPLGLLLDERGVHFDSSAPSDLETLLATHPLDDTQLLNRARDAIDRLKSENVSKYCNFHGDIEAPTPGYVLIIDQTKGDASIKCGGANADSFREMLAFAQEEHPGAPILLKTHPEARDGHRPGHFDASFATGRITLCDAPISPWVLLDGARAVYTVSSQLGFEAILAGHKPHVFGQPFYAGWGLTEDRAPIDRRQRKLTRAQLFAAAMILYPTWYDPYHDRLTTLETVIETLSAEARAWREDHRGWAAHGMRLWKRAPLQKVFGQTRPMVFDKPATDGRRTMVWASRWTEALGPASRVEDGFLRSRGLGAALVPPLSLVTDDLGIYYDPRRESRLERWIAARESLPPWAEARAERLRKNLIATGLSKYNLPGAVPDLPQGQRILVPGQVEDDASILTGTNAVATNRALLEAARAANPEAVILYKPHPDVEAGLRKGTLDRDTALSLADAVLEQADPVTLIEAVDAVWTMTSLLGFEALIRGVPVTCLGAPFYAGWGLTTDLGAVPARRKARPSLAGLIHAALIDYPRYIDPVTGRPCPVEVAVDRLAAGEIPHPGAGNRALAKLQGLFASYAHLWR